MRRIVCDYANGQREIRDGLDIRWWDFLQGCFSGLSFIPLPNSPHATEYLLEECFFSGFILTGGDDWGVFPERDRTETAILEYARTKKLPIIGVCRGAQVINRILGGSLTQIHNHAGTRHPVYFNSGFGRSVNSYHNNAIKSLGKGLECVARDENGFIEAYCSANGLIQGIMWHPEREMDPDVSDLKLFAQMFERKQR